MIFSVWNYERRCFDYFEAPGTSANYGARGTKYRPLTQGPQGALSGTAGQRTMIGFAPEALAIPLPSNVMPIGSGAAARGVIASSGRGAGHGRGVDGVSGLAGLGGLGGDEVVVEPTPPPAYPFGQVLVAACLASIVGVFVQRALNKKK